MKGDLDELDIYIGVASKKGTQLFIPISGARSIGEHDFIKFRNPNIDSLILPTNEDISLSGIKLAFDLEITPQAEVQIILDEQTGDIIKGKGDGNIKMEITTLGDFNIYGNYNIEKGDYLFTLKNIINKRFQIKQGGSISWSGDPYEAKINISAVYKLRANITDLVREYELAGLTEEDKKEIKKRKPVDLELILTGSLLNPNIDFNIDVRGVESSVNSFVTRRLREIESDKHELNNQVFGLLVMNRFIPSSESSSQPGFKTGVNTSVSELLTSQLSSWLSQYRDDIDFDISYFSYESTDIDNLGGADLQRRELEIALTKRFFNDRISVNVGGNLDMGQTGQSQDVQNSSTIAGDFILEYQISEDGKFKVKLFRKTDYDIFAERYNKTGVGIFYREEFDRLSDLWRRRQ